MPADSFEQLEATLLLCPKCRVAVPVRKRLLLILPQGNKFEYVCTRCASVCGDKIEPDVPPGNRRSPSPTAAVIAANSVCASNGGSISTSARFSGGGSIAANAP